MFVTGISFDSTSDYDIATIKYNEPIGIQPISNEEPGKFELYQNYPNPFNPSTVIRFQVDRTSLNPPLVKGGIVRSTGGLVTLKVYDILGREVANLVNEQLNPGTYEVRYDATELPSGIYFYRLSTDSFSKSMKMIVLK